MLRIINTPFLFQNSTPKYNTELLDITQHYGIAILNVTDDNTVTISEINNEFSQLTGQNKNKLADINLHECPIWDDDKQLWKEINQCLNKQKTQVFNWKFICRDNARSLKCSIVPTFGKKKKPSTITLILSNNSADSDFADQIEKFNYYDGLTGLPNQNFLNEKLETNFSENFPNGEIAILLVNIIKFQRVNESFGYTQGDNILKNVAYKIDAHLPPNAILTRFNSDKFAILLYDKAIGNTQKEAQALANSLHHEMNKPILTESQEIHLSLAIGISIGSSPFIDSNILIQQAHIAMTRLNITNQDRTLVYQPELLTRTNSRLQLENDLRDALVNKDLFLNYQPIISLQNGELIGFEALCRWDHPTQGIIPPIEFIPLSEETGLIIPLGTWALNEACKSLRILIDKFPHFSNLIINVNVSGLQLLQDGFVKTTQAAVLNAGLTCQNLTLEITETTLVENSEAMRDILLDLKALDIGLAIDDFGTGYSSLSYLNQFPVDTLKIDKSFVNKISANADSYKIIHIITTLAQTLGMNVVAEGIELEDQLDALKKLGCHKGQGYLFSKPLSFEDAEKYIKSEPTSLV